MEVANAGIMSLGFETLSAGLLGVFIVAMLTTVDPVVRLTATPLDEYDYIVIGTGSGGAPVAGRLSENPDIKVLVLEAGYLPKKLSVYPVLASYLQRTTMDWSYPTVPQSRACLGLTNNVNLWPRGKAVGGSPAINFMLYVRGSPVDYDDWAAITGDSTWSWNNVFPYFLKAENQTDPAYLNEYHATGGPLNIETPKYHSPIVQAFMDSAPLVGYETIELNGADHVGFALPQGTTKDGLRDSAARAYLGSASLRDNLHVLENAFVTKIIIDETKTAKQVQFDYGGQSITVSATKEIILSAGVINSPQVLMLSGVGPRDQLEANGIPVILDKPGVGQNLFEHLAVWGQHFTINPNAGISVDSIAADLPAYFGGDHSGPVSVLGGVEAFAFVRTNYTDPNSPRGDVQFHFVTASPSNDVSSYKSNNFNQEVIDQFYNPYLNQESVSIIPVILQPKSRGTVRLASNNPYDYPMIDPNYLENAEDLAVLTDGLRIGYEIGTTEPMKNMGSRPFTSDLPGCEAFERFTEPYWECVVKTLTFGIYHPGGTCKMGKTTDPMAVVDSKFRVIGIKNLRVVDMSAMATPLSGNYNAPGIMMAEKAADMIKKGD